MEFGQYSTTRRILVSFMDFLSKIQIEKYSSVLNGYVTRKTISVPVQFSSRDKWLEIYKSSTSRKAMDPSLQNAVEMQWVLPRIGVQFSSFNYDPQRSLIKTQQVLDTSKVSYTPAPYNIDIDVYVVSKNLDENIQIMEQLIPKFRPGMNLDIKLVDDTPYSTNFVLTNVTQDIPVDLSESEERLVTFIYTFTIKANYFPQKQVYGFVETNFTNLTFETSPVSGDINQYNVSNGEFSKFTNSWNSIFSIPSSATISSDRGYPSSLLSYDYYLDVMSNKLYKKINDNYEFVGSLPSIPSTYTNSSIDVVYSLPSSGEENSFVVNNTDKKVYKEENGSWIPVLTLSNNNISFVESLPSSGTNLEYVVDNKGNIFQFIQNQWLLIYSVGVIKYPNTKPLIYNIKSNTHYGIDYIEVDQKWIESQQKFETKFNSYVSTSSSPNPFI